MSPQTGLPHNNRVGDFDVFALPALMRATGKTLDQVLDDLANRSGLLGLSGYNDLRDIEEDARKGGAASQLALDVFIASVRHYLGAYLVLLDGADAIVFTGGIGENSSRMREAVCANLDWFGIALDPLKQRQRQGRGGDPRARQPGADLDHADQRGAGRRPAGESAAGRAITERGVHVPGESHRRGGGDAEGRRR